MSNSGHHGQGQHEHHGQDMDSTSVDISTSTDSSESEETRKPLRDRPASIGAFFKLKSKTMETTEETPFQSYRRSGAWKRTITAEFQMSTDEVEKWNPSVVKRTNTASTLTSHVTIRLGDNHVMQCYYSPNDTLEGLIDALRRRGKVFRVDDVILRGFSLNNWKQQSMEAIGVQGSDEIHIIEEKKSRKVTVRIESTDIAMDVQVNFGENCWNQIKKKLPLPIKPHFDATVQRGLFYRHSHEWRRAVAAYHSQDTHVYLDEENGEAVDDTKKPLLFAQFLAPREGLRAAPQGEPHLELYDAVLGWENEHTVVLNPTAPFNHNYVACLWGFYCFTRKTSLLFLQIYGNCYVECLSGSKEFTREKLLEYHKNEGLTPQAICLLLRENSRIPHWHNRSSKYFALYRRDGVELNILKGRLFCATPSIFVEGSSCWILRCSETPFDEEFNREVVKKKKKQHDHHNTSTTLHDYI